MRTKKFVIFIIVAAVVIGGISLYLKGVKQKEANGAEIKEIRPTIGSIKNYISSSGTVLPKNRLEIKPPVNGRIDRILVQEGEQVKAGQILAWMSSTERAALLDAARGKGEEYFKYWEETYKPIPLPAPIDGEVIVATTQPGQTVTTSDAVLVLSDHLIVRAQVDETDIGKITPEMKAFISLDAYPDTKINATVEHIYYESQTVNNVTIYQVDLKPEKVPVFFRSGMNATVDFIEKSADNVLLVPLDAVHKGKNGDFCLVKQENSPVPVKVRVEVGISDDNNTEILSGITENDKVIIKAKKYSLPTSKRGKNPFLPGH